ncbi:TonB-dependent receptor plug domain-containing protein [Luteimonas kalidii]|uniref:TonB-dependent receptor n=1 Tax=Luteimonas kalidii TaxID=3042025 RepID=A0ABT6JRF4_9GAMM|nr:TonB-dependent receptor [Luteimonas kalidii]MDH5833268.1 TonB-dependent receptor [Luteimonas kalidii]
MLAPAAGAQDTPDLATLSLEELLDVEIVTASRFQQSVAQAPSVVQVIGADEIRRHGWRTLAEALDSLPGLFLSDTGLYTYLGTRGLLRAGDYNTRFLVLVNGQRINDAVYSQGPVGAEFPVDMALVERIEYAPGPGSAVYGSNAFFGVINVLTRDAQSVGDGQLRAVAGNFGSSGVQVTLPVNGGGGSTLLSARQFHRSGRDLFVPEFADGPSRGLAAGHDDERVRQLFVRHVQGGLALQLFAGDRRREDPVAPYLQTFGAPGGQVQDRWIGFGAHYGVRLGEATEASARLEVNDFRYVGDYVYGDADELYLNRDVASGRSFSLGGQLVSRLGPRYTVVAGAEVQLDRSIEQRNFDLAPPASYLDSRQDMASWGVFVDNEVRLGGHWNFSGGLRVDRSDLGTVRLSPRMALVMSRPDDGVFKLIVGQSYRSPNAYERYYQVESEEGSQLANPSLGAEHVRSAEVFYGVGLSAHSRAELSVYHYRLRDLITLVPVDDASLMLTNAGSAASRGAELAYAYQPPSGVSLRASYAYADVSDSETERPLNAPRGIARISGYWPLAADWGLAMSAQRMGRRASRAAMAPAYSMVNANLHWRPVALPVSLALGVRNLLDERTFDPVGPEFTQDLFERSGRHYLLEATWRF